MCKEDGWARYVAREARNAAFRSQWSSFEVFRVGLERKVVITSAMHHLVQKRHRNLVIALRDENIEVDVDDA